jgi:hypothetical protein
MASIDALIFGDVMSQKISSPETNVHEEININGFAKL